MNSPYCKRHACAACHMIWCEKHPKRKKQAPVDPAPVITYVNVTTKGCEGSLNLFVGEHCVAWIKNTRIADTVRSCANERGKA